MTTTTTLKKQAQVNGFVSQYEEVTEKLHRERQTSLDGRQAGGERNKHTENNKVQSQTGRQVEEPSVWVTKNASTFHDNEQTTYTLFFFLGVKERLQSRQKWTPLAG